MAWSTDNRLATIYYSLESEFWLRLSRIFVSLLHLGCSFPDYTLLLWQISKLIGCVALSSFLFDDSPDNYALLFDNLLEAHKSIAALVHTLLSLLLDIMSKSRCELELFFACILELLL